MILSIRLSVAVVLALGCITASGQGKRQKPNFIIVMTDDQGYGDAGYLSNNKVKTPNLDDMAQKGLRLDRFYTAPVCSPTRAGVLTGRYPTRTGFFSWGHILRPQEKSFVNLLKAAGYQTGFFGKWHIGSIAADKETNPGANGFSTWYAAANFYENDPWMSKNGEPVHLIGEGSDVTVRLALDYMEEVIQQDAPFILFIWLGSPHLPHQATEELKQLYPDEPENMKNYYGELTGVDRSIGRLRQWLQDRGIADQTLLWFSSDNGGKLPEASNGVLRGQKGTLREGGIRVPALIEWPGKISGMHSAIPVSMVDIFPTVLELAGVDISTVRYPLDGISLVPLIRGDMQQRSTPIGFWNYDQIKGYGMKSDQIIRDYQRILQEGLPADSLREGLLNEPDRVYPGLDGFPYAGQSAWIDNDWKLYQQGDTFELYHVKRDIRERHNVAGKYPDKLKQMKEELLNWQNSVIRSMRGEDYR